VVFQDGKDIRWDSVFLLFFFTIIFGAILYLVFVKRQQVTLTFMPLNGSIDVLAAGNTPESQKVAKAFLRALPS
jgi:hypothetical protein